MNILILQFAVLSIFFYFAGFSLVMAFSAVYFVGSLNELVVAILQFFFFQRCLFHIILMVSFFFFSATSVHGCMYPSFLLNCILLVVKFLYEYLCEGMLSNLLDGVCAIALVVLMGVIDRSYSFSLTLPYLLWFGSY